MRWTLGGARGFSAVAIALALAGLVGFGGGGFAQTQVYTYDDLGRLKIVVNGGTTTTYTYDAAGNRTKVETTAANVAPTAVNDALKIKKGATRFVDVLANDTDPNQDTLLVDSVGTPGQGGAIVQGGAVYYTAPTSWTGDTSFTYKVTDAKSTPVQGTVNVTVQNNTPPVAADNFYVIGMNQALSNVDPRVGDSDFDQDPLTVTNVGAASPGGSPSFTASTVSYSPPTNFTGSASFSYTISDGEATAQANVIVGVVTLLQPTFEASSNNDDYYFSNPPAINYSHGLDPPNAYLTMSDGNVTSHASTHATEPNSENWVEARFNDKQRVSFIGLRTLYPTFGQEASYLNGAIVEYRNEADTQWVPVHTVSGISTSSEYIVGLGSVRTKKVRIRNGGTYLAVGDFRVVGWPDP